MLLDNEVLTCFGSNIGGIFLTGSTGDILGQGQLLESPGVQLGTYERILDFCISDMSDVNFIGTDEMAVCALLEFNGSSFIKCWGMV